MVETTSSGGLHIFLAAGTLQVSVGLSDQTHVDFIGHTPRGFCVTDLLKSCLGLQTLCFPDLPS